ncbi:MAG: disulfide bond formation protein B [Hyphomicrobium sp.]|nr:disulfide bond formation protein B [Hyphomicrobium sp.]
MTPRIAVLLNTLGLYAISVVLLAAFVFQITLQELPCPLCLLQRVAFTALAVGLILTLRYGPKPSHYGLTIIAALAGAGIAGRQVLLHIQPGDPGFGSSILGFHFYTWAFIFFIGAIAACAAVLLFNKQFAGRDQPPSLGLFDRVAVWLVISITFVNAAGALIECGVGFCPANPVVYELLHRPDTT